MKLDFTLKALPSRRKGIADKCRAIVCEFIESDNKVAHVARDNDEPFSSVVNALTRVIKANNEHIKVAKRREEIYLIRVDSN